MQSPPYAVTWHVSPHWRIPSHPLPTTRWSFTAILHGRHVAVDAVEVDVAVWVERVLELVSVVVSLCVQ